MDNDKKYVFFGEWFQSEALVKHNFIINFYPVDNSIEIILGRKFFLRRIEVDSVRLKDMFIGSRIFVFGRKILITDYGNLETKLKMTRDQLAFILFPNKYLERLDEIFAKIKSLNLHINNCFITQVAKEGDLSGFSNISADLKNDLLDKPLIAFELSGKNAVQKVADLQIIFQLVYSFKDNAFDGLSKETLNDNNRRDSVLALIKPHAFHEDKTADIISKIIRNSFDIKNMKLCHLERDECEEFYKIYDTVLPEFIQMCIQLASGPFLALELVESNESSGCTHSKFRNLCGPYDPEIAKQVRPQSLRAEFGINKVNNAVHCTDLKDDIRSEIDFFFH